MGGSPRNLHDERREDRHQHQEDQEDAAGEGDLVPLEPQPGDLTERAALDRPPPASTASGAAASAAVPASGGNVNFPSYPGVT